MARIIKGDNLQLAIPLLEQLIKKHNRQPDAVQLEIAQQESDDSDPKDGAADGITIIVHDVKFNAFGNPAFQEFGEKLVAAAEVEGEPQTLVTSLEDIGYGQCKLKIQQLDLDNAFFKPSSVLWDKRLYELRSKAGNINKDTISKNEKEIVQNIRDIVTHFSNLRHRNDLGAGLNNYMELINVSKNKYLQATQDADEQQASPVCALADEMIEILQDAKNILGQYQALNEAVANTPSAPRSDHFRDSSGRGGGRG